MLKLVEFMKDNQQSTIEVSYTYKSGAFSKMDTNKIKLNGILFNRISNTNFYHSPSHPDWTLFVPTTTSFIFNTKLFIRKN